MELEGTISSKIPFIPECGRFCKKNILRYLDLYYEYKYKFIYIFLFINKKIIYLYKLKTFPIRSFKKLFL